MLNERPHPLDRAPSALDLASPLPAWGPRTVTLQAGRLEVALDGLDDRLAALALERYAGFAREGEPGPHGSRARVVRSPQPTWLHLSRDDGPEEARIHARSEADRIVLWSYGFAAAFDREGRSARLLLSGGDALRAGQAIENFLRFFVATRATHAGGFILHASGVVVDGRAYLFFGPSGAGKTTAASHAPEGAALLGDDLVLVEPDEAGFRASGVPFRGSGSPGPNAPVSAPIAIACRVFQAGEDRLEEVTKPVQAAEILGEVPYALDDARLRDRAAEVAERFVRAVHVRRLRLRDDPAFWRLLTE